MVELFDCNNTSLKQGSKGAKVTLLQNHLKTLGYYKEYKVDGDYGYYTKQEVAKFQKANGLSNDGWFGPKTCKVLNDKINAKNTVTNTVTTTSQVFDCPNINLKKGDKGELVTKLQNEMKKLGYYTRQVDGDFGQYTEEAVKKFQKAKGGLLTDGIFGPITCKKLNTTTTSVKTTAATAKAAEPPKDPYAVDISKNVLKEEDSNLSIDGIFFSVSNITFTNPIRSASFKRIDLVDGGQYIYQSSVAPREYSVDCMMTRDEWEQLKNELYKIQNRKCKVVTPLFESGNYSVEVSLAYQNVNFRKVTMKFVEWL